MNFKVAIDCSLLELIPDSGIAPIDNKNVCTVLNDFEEGKWRADQFQNFIWDNIEKQRFLCRSARP